MERSQHRPQVWSVASGKGGVGKTFITTSLAISLSKLGYSVIILDMDESSGNVHTSLGIDPSFLNIRHFFEGVKTLQEVVIPTPYPHLSYVQGFWDNWKKMELDTAHAKKLFSEVRHLNCDFVIIDLAPGASDSHLEIARSSDEHFLVTTPEPTSVEKNYRYLESLLLFEAQKNLNEENLKKLIITLNGYRQRSLQEPFSFREFYKNIVSSVDGDAFASLDKSPVRLLVNQCRSQNHRAFGYSIKSVVNKYYDLSIDFTGAIDYDNAVWQSVHKRENVLLAQPFTGLAGQFLTICKHIVEPQDLRAVV